MLNVLKQARAAFSMLNPSEVHKRIRRPITFGLVAANDREFSDLERFLLPASLTIPERDDLRAEIYRAGARSTLWRKRKCRAWLEEQAPRRHEMRTVTWASSRGNGVQSAAKNSSGLRAGISFTSDPGKENTSK